VPLRCCRNRRETFFSIRLAEIPHILVAEKDYTGPVVMKIPESSADKAERVNRTQ
jgi:hypothetical protein